MIYRRMKHIVKGLNVMVVAMMTMGLVSCGLAFEMDEESLGATSMRLDRESIDVLEGDTIVLKAIFTPDSVSNKSVYWTTENRDVVSHIGGDSLLAVGEGQTVVAAISVSDRLMAMCTVNVLPVWQNFYTNYSYPYEMVVYADISVGGKPLRDDDIVAAFVGNTLRGVGKTQVINNHRFTVIRVGSDVIGKADDDMPWAEQEVEFRIYRRSELHLYTCKETIIYDGESHGSLSQLFELTAE